MIETVDDMPLKIVSARTYLLRVPVPALRVDAQSAIDAWDALAVAMVTDAGLIGCGYQCGSGLPWRHCSTLSRARSCRICSAAMLVDIASGGRSSISCAITLD